MGKAFLARIEREVGVEGLVGALERLDVGAEIDADRESGRGYYARLCFKVYAGDVEVADGGFVTWTQTLLGDRKERLLISGLGSERVVQLP
jgi:hypothetical protein